MKSKKLLLPCASNKNGFAKKTRRVEDGHGGDKLDAVSGRLGRKRNEITKQKTRMQLDGERSRRRKEATGPASPFAMFTGKPEAQPRPNPKTWSKHQKNTFAKAPKKFGFFVVP
jgi:hypothetical protein